MAIDDSGDWWIGSEPSDIQEFLAAFTHSKDAYPAESYRLVRCLCGSERFTLDRSAEVTRRTCAACGTSRFICREA